ncbi:hypothetical protein GOBAR_DD28536 [Gossypium barbadense]|nr:hypothetical protein GOBAR_DD28536 [Gossypium barbadense]
MAIIDGQPLARRAHIGNVLDDGALVDFTGCGRSWVGLYAGVPGRAFHIWDGNTEELVYLNASLTDPEVVMGWHMLTEFTETIGRQHRRGLRVTCFDTNNEAFITVDNRGRAIVRRAGTLEEVCRFHTRHSNAIGCVNLGYALMCSVGVVRTWEIEQGQYLYSLNENIEAINAMVADDRHVAAVGTSLYTYGILVHSSVW